MPVPVIPNGFMPSTDAGSALGTALSNNYWQTISDAAAMQFSAHEAQLDRDWQTSANQAAMQFSADQAELSWNRYLDLYNTAYQRRAADLKKAGLNPVMALMHGASVSPPTSTGQGYTSQGSTARGVSGHRTNDIPQLVSAILGLVGNTMTSAAKIVAAG